MILGRGMLDRWSRGGWSRGRNMLLVRGMVDRWRVE
jgi:hypothetical protein